MNAPRRVTRLTPPPNPGLSRVLAERVHDLQSLEARLLRTIRQAAKGVARLEELMRDLRALLEDLQHSYLRLVDVMDRRDLLFTHEVKIRQLVQHHVWLYRRIHLEQFFLYKLSLETSLRALISEEAFEVYQDLQGIEEMERAFLRRTDDEVRRALQEGEVSEFWIHDLDVSPP
jgi:hypothetical protein